MTLYNNDDYPNSIKRCSRFVPCIRKSQTFTNCTRYDVKDKFECNFHKNLVEKVKDKHGRGRSRIRSKRKVFTTPTQALESESKIFLQHIKYTYPAIRIILLTFMWYPRIRCRVGLALGVSICVRILEATLTSCFQKHLTPASYFAKHRNVSSMQEIPVDFTPENRHNVAYYSEAL